MKSAQFQKYSKKVLPFAILYGLILVFTFGMPLSGRDFTLAARMQGSGVSAWVDAMGQSGGNILSGLLSGICIDVPILRHVVTATFLGTVIVVLIFYSNVERSYMYFVVLLLGLATPKGIFAHTFAQVMGASTAVIPALLTVLYMFTVCDLFIYKGQKKTWKIPFLFLSGFVSQLFSESVGVCVLVLSLIFLVKLTSKHGFSWHLGAHFFGCVLGLVLNLVIPGGRDSFSDSFYHMIDQFTVALDQIFVQNLLLISLLTLGCLLLIKPIRTDRSKNCNKTLLLLLVPYGLFLFLNVIGVSLVHFNLVYRYLTVLKMLAALSYTYGIYRTVQHYVSKDRVIYRIYHSLAVIWVFILVYSFLGTAKPDLLYIPYLFTVAITVLLFGYAFRHYSRLEKILRKPLFITAIAGVLALSFVTASNNNYAKSVDIHIRDSLSIGNLRISLPDAPYKGRFVEAEFDELSQYYDFASYGDVQITYVPFGQWDWASYYEAQNVPSDEEYDEKEQEAQEWLSEFEEENE